MIFNKDSLKNVLFNKSYIVINEVNKMENLYKKNKIFYLFYSFFDVF